MSTIGKKPFVEQLFDLQSEGYLSNIKNKINSNSVDGEFDFDNISEQSNPLMIMLNCKDGKSARYGLLIAKSDYYAFLDIDTRTQEVKSYLCLTASNSEEEETITIDGYNFIVNHSLSPIDEYCDIEEIRRILDDTVEATGDTWVDEMKTVMEKDNSGNVQLSNGLVVGNNLSVDGITHLANDIHIEGDTEIDGQTSIDGNITVSGTITGSEVEQAIDTTKYFKLKGNGKVESEEITANGKTFTFQNQLFKVSVIGNILHWCWLTGWICGSQSITKTDLEGISRTLYISLPDEIYKKISVVGTTVNLGTGVGNLQVSVYTGNDIGIPWTSACQGLKPEFMIVIYPQYTSATTVMEANKTYYLRLEGTILLGENLSKNLG